MAKKKSNKSQMVRDILTKDPKTPVKDIVSSMQGQGQKISANLVYLIKSKMKGKKRKAKREKAMAVTTKAGVENPVALIRDVRALADRAGGLKNLKELVDILGQ